MSVFEKIKAIAEADGALNTELNPVTGPQLNIEKVAAKLAEFISQNTEVLQFIPGSSLTTKTLNHFTRRAFHIQLNALPRANKEELMVIIASLKCYYLLLNSEEQQKIIAAIPSIKSENLDHELLNTIIATLNSMAAFAKNSDIRRLACGSLLQFTKIEQEAFKDLCALFREYEGMEKETLAYDCLAFFQNEKISDATSLSFVAFFFEILKDCKMPGLLKLKILNLLETFNFPASDEKSISNFRLLLENIINDQTQDQLDLRIIAAKTLLKLLANENLSPDEAKQTVKTMESLILEKALPIEIKKEIIKAMSTLFFAPNIKAETSQEIVHFFSKLAKMDLLTGQELTPFLSWEKAQELPKEKYSVIQNFWMKDLFSQQEKKEALLDILLKLKNKEISSETRSSLQHFVANILSSSQNEKLYEPVAHTILTLAQGDGEIANDMVKILILAAKKQSSIQQKNLLSLSNLLLTTKNEIVINQILSFFKETLQPTIEDVDSFPETTLSEELKSIVRQALQQFCAISTTPSSMKIEIFALLTMENNSKALEQLNELTNIYLPEKEVILLVRLLEKIMQDSTAEETRRQACETLSKLFLQASDTLLIKIFYHLPRIAHLKTLEEGMVTKPFLNDITKLATTLFESKFQPSFSMDLTRLKLLSCFLPFLEETQIDTFACHLLQIDTSMLKSQEDLVQFVTILTNAKSHCEAVSLNQQLLSKIDKLSQDERIRQQPEVKACLRFLGLEKEEALVH